MNRRTATLGGILAPAESDDPALAISTEPIVNFAFRWLVDIAFALFVLAIVYMSFVPFDFTFSRPDKGWRAGRVILGLTTSPFNLPDILANIAYYMPIATIGFFVLRRRMGWLATTVSILVLGSALSFGVEFGQQWTRTRVPSWSDLMANVLGLVVGLGTAVLIQPTMRLFLRSAQEAVRSDLPGTIAKLLVCLLLVIHVRPFDLVADVPRRVIDVVRHGDFRPTARWEALSESRGMAPSTKNGISPALAVRARYEYPMNLLAVTAGYAALSCMLSLSTRRDRTGLNLASIAWSGFVTVSVAGIVTALRVLMVSHSLDTAHVACGLVGWPIGVIVARLLRVDQRREKSLDAGRSSRATRWDDAFVGAVASWAPFFSLVGLAWVIAYELVPFDFSWASLRQARSAGRIVILPMSGHLAGSIGNLVADVSAKYLRYAALAACIVWLIAGPSRMSWRARALLVTVSTAAAVAVLQGIHLFQASRYCDATNVLIAAVAAAVTVVMLRGIRDFYRASPRVVDNLLTRRLIEGKSFDKNAFNSLRRSRNSASPTEAASTGPRD